MIKFSEKCFYVCLIAILIILAILLPLIIIQTGKSYAHHYIYVSTADDNSTKSDDSTNYGEEHLNNYLPLDKLQDHLEDFTKYRSVIYSLDKIGETKNEKNPIHEVTLKKKGSDPSKVLIVSGILANDWASILTSIEIMDSFFLDVKRTSKLMNHFSFHFIPLLNPDGYNFSMSLPIHSNWEKNYEGTSDHKPKGRNILTDFGKDTENPHEATLFKTYFTKHKSYIKATFFLFTPDSILYGTDRYFAIPDAYFGNDNEKRALVENLATAIKQERDFEFNIEDAPVGRIDNWVVKATQPKPILVVNICANFRAGPPEALSPTIKKRGEAAHFIITRLLSVLDKVLDDERT